MKNLLLIFIGGGAGSVCRYLIANNLNTNFPYGTLLINLLGCFLIGIFLGSIEKFNLYKELSLIFVIGFCGGFTTFSTLMNENFLMFKNKMWVDLLLYNGLSFILGLCLVFVGYYLVEKL